MRDAGPLRMECNYARRGKKSCRKMILMYHRIHSAHLTQTYNRQTVMYSSYNARGIRELIRRTVSVYHRLLRLLLTARVVP